MDLRMVKTRAQIKKAFLKLREKFMPEKIKVKDICEMAMINKTTFYNHYADSMQLSDEIDNLAIDSVVSNLSDHNIISLSDPENQIKNILSALENEAETLKIVFRGKQDVLCMKLENRLHEMYGKDLTDPDDQICASFAIGGFVRVIRDYLFSESKYNIDRLVKSTSNMLKVLIKRKKTVSNGIN